MKKTLPVISIIVGFVALSFVFDNSAYALWIQRSQQELLEQSQTIFVGNITGVKAVQVEESTKYEMEEGGILKTIIENYTLTLDDYDVKVEEFLKNPQIFDYIKVRQPTISGAPSRLHVLGGFEAGDRVLFYLDKIDGKTMYSPESFKIPKPCMGKDVLMQKRLEMGGDFAMTQNGNKISYDNITANSPILFVYDKDMNTLSGKNFDVTIEISQYDGKHVKAVFNKEIHSGSKSCEWIAAAEWEFTPKEGTYIIDINTKRDDNSTEYSSTAFSVKSDTKHNYVSPLKQYKAETREPIKCKSGLELLRKASNGFPACVKPQTKTELLKHGWGSDTWPFKSVQKAGLSLSTICTQNSGHWLGQYKECEYVSAEKCSLLGGKYEEKSNCRHSPSSEWCASEGMPVCTIGNTVSSNTEYQNTQREITILSISPQNVTLPEPKKQTAKTTCNDGACFTPE